MRRSARPLWASVAALVVAASAIVLPSSASAVTGDPTIATTPEGVTSVAPTQGKAQGSGLWGYVGDITTHESGKTFTYGLSFSPVDGSLWVTDSAKIVYNNNAFFCGISGGTVMGNLCYVGDSRVMHYDLNTTDWAAGQYLTDGAYAVPAAGVNEGIGVNFDALADAQVLDGSTLPNGQFVGARGVAVTEAGVAWVLDSDHVGTVMNPTGKPVRLINPDGTEGASFGQALPTTVGWQNRHAPDVLGYTVGITRLENGNMVATTQTPQLLKEYKSDGTFVRNIFLNQPADTAYPTDPGYRSPYAVTADHTTAANDVLVGYIDPGAGKGSFVERIDLDACESEAVGNPTGSSRDRCAVLQRFGVGTMSNGNGNDSTSPAVTFAIAVDPTTQDVYVGQRNGQLSVFASDGTPKGKFSAFGTGNKNGQVRLVRGITFDERGFMYLTVDEGSATTRVQIFARTPDPVSGLTAAYTSLAKTDVTLTWDALALGVTADAQTPLRDYVVEASTDGGATWAVVPTPVGTDATATLTGLDPDASYEFRVSAWNEAGNGNWIAAAPAEPVAALTLTKQGNGTPAPTADAAVSVPADSDVTFTYVLKNTGTVPATGVALADDKLGVVAPPVGFTGTLAAGESVTFTATGPIAAGDYVNVATATSNETEDVVAEWHGFGVTTGLAIVKQGNALVATSLDDAVHVPADSTVTFTYVVTNKGNVPARGVSVVDDQLGDIAPPADFTGTLAAGESVTFTASGVVAAGAYVNTATGSAEGVESVTTQWHGFGESPVTPVPTTEPPTPQPSAPALPQTGADGEVAGFIAAIAGAFLVGGAVLFGIRRRRAS